MERYIIMIETILAIIASIVSSAVLIILVFYLIKLKINYHSKKPIRVGILNSITGTMAISEKAVVDAFMMAIEELNEIDGIDGRKIKPFICDGASEADIFEKQAEYLIDKKKVSVIFGCWRSDCRKAVKEVVEKHNHLLIYPVQYEGLELSDNIIYTGITANQNIIPTTKWLLENLGRRVYLVGSDYVFPKVAHHIIKEQVNLLGGEVAGDFYFPLGTADVDGVVDEIAKLSPDVIINTINSETNIHFYRALRKRGIFSSDIPTVSFSITEEEIRHIGKEYVTGDYAAWGYFQNLPNKINQDFVKKYKDTYGDDRVTTDVVESAYVSVMLWAEGVKDAKTENPNIVKKAIQNQFFYGPSGRFYIDPVYSHTTKILRIGKIRSDGQFDVVWSSMNPINPVPYPDYHTREEWDDYLNKLYIQWGNRWSGS